MASRSSSQYCAQRSPFYTFRSRYISLDLSLSHALPSFFLSFVVLSFQSLPFDFFIIAVSGLTSQVKNEALTKLFFSQTEIHQFYPFEPVWSRREPEDDSISFLSNFWALKFIPWETLNFCLLETSLFDWTFAFCRNRNCSNLLCLTAYHFSLKDHPLRIEIPKAGVLSVFDASLQYKKRLFPHGWVSDSVFCLKIERNRNCEIGEKASNDSFKVEHWHS